ncbi:hypothetical protein CF641_37715 [Burkholderia pseudomallei]|nr:hypothetical protein CF641_37710 [Burkholderia pseudomallei]PNW89321.1 hypothetical protein CF641_37715 [Burkholderia pseudomallei]
MLLVVRIRRPAVFCSDASGACSCDVDVRALIVAFGGVAPRREMTVAYRRPVPHLRGAGLRWFFRTPAAQQAPQ